MSDAPEHAMDPLSGGVNSRDSHLREQLENSPMAVIEFDNDLRVIGWSKNAERIFGWAAEEIVGRRIIDFRWIHEDDISGVLQISRQMSSGARTSTISQNRNYRKDGEIICCEWYNSSLFDQNGRLRSQLSFVLDVTERRRAEDALQESQTRLALAQRAARIGTFESFVQTGRLVWTESLERLFGLEPGSFEGTLDAWRKRVHPDDLPRITEKMQKYRIQQRPDIEYEFRAILPDGQERILYTRAVISYDAHTGQAVRVLGVNIDITERVQAEAERERLLAEAEHEIARRLEVERQLRRVNEDLQQFAYSASHDLQEPLRTVAVYSQLMRRRYAGQLDANADRFLQFMDDAAHRMESLLSDLLQYTQITSETHDEVFPVDTAAVLDSVLKQIHPAIVSSGATIQAGNLPVVRVWPVHVQQIFQNLIGNALKYRSERPPVISVGCERKDDSHVFHVTDNGIGIAPQYQQQIFGIFKRLHTQSQYPGTGIGLAICQKLVQQYGGKIWVESEFGAGSTFRFTLPAFGADASSKF